MVSGTKAIPVNLIYSKNNYLSVALKDNGFWVGNVTQLPKHCRDGAFTYIIGKNSIDRIQLFFIERRFSRKFYRYHIVDTMLFPNWNRYSLAIDFGLTETELKMSPGVTFGKTSQSLFLSWTNRFSSGEGSIETNRNEITLTCGERQITVNSQTGLLIRDLFPNKENSNRSIVLKNISWEEPSKDFRDTIPDFDKLKIKKPLSPEMRKLIAITNLKSYYTNKFQDLKILPKEVVERLKREAREKGAEFELVFTKEYPEFISELQDDITERFDIEITTNNIARAKPMFLKVAAESVKGHLDDASIFTIEERKTIPPILIEIDNLWMEQYFAGFQEALCIDMANQKEPGGVYEN